VKVLLGSFSAITVLRGGVEVQVRSLARELRAYGVEAELFDPWRRYDLSGYSLVHIFGAHVGTYHLARSMHDLGMRLFVSPVYFSRRRRGRVARSAAIASLLRRFGGFWTEQAFCRDLCHLADRVLPNTQAEADLVCSAFGIRKDKVSVVPNGVDERFLHATPDLFVQRHGIRDFVLYAGHVGWERKNVLRMLRALRGLPRPLVVMGTLLDNAYGRACRDAASDDDNVLLVPPVPPDDPLLASAYAACDTLILPSYYETPGLAALEAALAGAKVCITRYGGTAEYFGPLADYLEPDSEQSIRAAVDAAIARPRTEVLREIVRGKYLWGNVAGVLAGTYRSSHQPAIFT